jgi:GNAT superfamily N-acetyltransferase
LSLEVRPLGERDLDRADHIFRLAFGTFLGLADPLRFGGDADCVRTRFRSPCVSALAAELDGELVGSNFATRWGSFGFFGPLTVRPDLWDRGIARRLLERTMPIFDDWKTTHRGLFTFSHSPKHHALYQKFGFYPRFLTAVMRKPIAHAAADAPPRYSALAASARSRWLERQREVADTLYAGLDLAGEIHATESSGLGDTVFVEDGDRLAGFAVCHMGSETEAGSGTCYVKFGAVRCGASARSDFARLLDACDAQAVVAGATRLVAGVNLAREHAYRALLERGFRADFVGVAMQSGNEPAFNRPDVLALDDWR